MLVEISQIKEVLYHLKFVLWCAYCIWQLVHLCWWKMSLEHLNETHKVCCLALELNESSNLVVADAWVCRLLVIIIVNGLDVFYFEIWLDASLFGCRMWFLDYQSTKEPLKLFQLMKLMKWFKYIVSWCNGWNTKCIKLKRVKGAKKSHIFLVSVSLYWLGAVHR